jgi:translation initiation factor 5B
MDAEAKAKFEEEERLAVEEEKRKEEQRLAKKQREKEKIEQLKKEGKYLTKAQKEAKARNEQKLQQMMAAGIKVGGLAEGEAEKKKPAPDNKKRPAGRGVNKRVRLTGLPLHILAHS